MVSPLTSGEEVGVVRHTHHLRGATWYDAQDEIVWLCAFRRHRSGSSDDSFQYFPELDAEDRLLPEKGDLRAAYEDEGRRLIAALRIEIPELLEQARASPETEVRALLADRIPVSVEIVRGTGSRS